jgi:hypothetical protein
MEEIYNNSLLPGLASMRMFLSMPDNRKTLLLPGRIQ